MTQPDIYIADTDAYHIRLMAEVMHPDSVSMALKLGISPNKALWRSYKQSIYCKTAFINGKIAAIWGLGASCFSDVAYPWLILTPDVEDHPFKVAFIYRKELMKMQELYPILEDYVDESNHKAVRLLQLMGFKMEGQKIERSGLNLLRAVRRI